MPTFVWIIILLVLAVVGFAAGTIYRKKVAEREISSAEDEAKRIINEAIKNAESKKREALVEAKEEIHKNRSDANSIECVILAPSTMPKAPNERKTDYRDAAKIARCLAYKIGRAHV